ncbi:MAG TPA: ATP-binding protein [Burkholderiaceae bacterium]|nr:ATP-binding protein [Burkholderiaceae bacterium]
MGLPGCETASQAARRGGRARAPGRLVAEIVIADSLPEIGRVHEPCRQAADEAGLGAGALADLLLILDEILSNAIRHAFPHGGVNEITVGFRVRRSGLEATVEYGGIAFDPADAPLPDRCSSLHERPLGGLGVHFVRELADELRYRRVGGRNRVMLTMRTGAGTRRKGSDGRP